jgi:hypothetical protein
MTLVRAAGAPGGGAAARPRLAWRARRGLAPIGGLAAAAALAGVAVLGAARASLPVATPAAAVAGVYDTLHAAAASRDTLGGALLRDTLRLVRFVLVAPTATRLALVGDFNRWDPTATPMATAESTGVWTAAVALRAGTHRYAFVVDDARWVADPAAAHRADSAGLPRSVVTVPGARN